MQAACNFARPGYHSYDSYHTQVFKQQCFTPNGNIIYTQTRMWANAQRDGRPANIGGALCSTPQSLPDAHY